MKPGGTLGKLPKSVTLFEWQLAGKAWMVIWLSISLALFGVKVKSDSSHNMLGPNKSGLL